MPRAPQSSQAKRWLFTLNNYTELEYDHVVSKCRELGSYAVIGRERGAEGTPHLQGYVIFTAQYRLARVKDLVSSRAHFEIARGSPASNRVYCTKEGDYIEVGVCPRADGHKSRDELATEWNEAFKTGRNGLDSFAAANPGCAAFSRHTLLRNSLAAAVPRDRPSIRVEWFYGSPGVGKSRMAHERLPDAFIKDPMTKWWTGYMLETTCIIDDFGKRGIGINHLLRWFDRYKCYVETKGDVVPLHVDSFIVTSNFHPRQCFFDDDGSEHPQIEALLRRMHVTHVLEFFPINTSTS